MKHVRKLHSSGESIDTSLFFFMEAVEKEQFTFMTGALKQQINCLLVLSTEKVIIKAASWQNVIKETAVGEQFLHSL